MDEETNVHLRWNHHQTTLLSVFSSLLNNENLVDCTISAEGHHFKAHRVILSACSPYFELLFSEHCEMHPVVILPDVKFQILKLLMEFMYSGEIEIPQDKLCTVLELAETLEIKGLSVTGESDKVDELGFKRRNESAILRDQQSLKKRLREPIIGSQVKQKDYVSSLHTLEKESSKDTDFHKLTSRKWGKSSSISSGKTVGKPVTLQDITDSEAFNEFRSSYHTGTLNKPNTCISEVLLNSVSNTFDFRRLSGFSEETREQRIPSENVLMMCSSSEELGTLEPLDMNSEISALTEIKQEDPKDFKGTITEIILDDDSDENDALDHGSGDDNSSTVGRRVISGDFFSGQGFCSVEQYSDTYFVEPPSALNNAYKCSACGRSYGYYRSLARHLKYECGKEPQFGCSQCSGRFFHKHDLKMHISRIHSVNLVQTVINRKLI